MDETYGVLKLYAEHSKLCVSKKVFATTRSKESLFVEFDFRTEDWNDVTITAIFNHTAIRILSPENNYRCDIPEEVLLGDGSFFVGVFGTRDDYRINTNQIECRVCEGSYTEDIEPVDITQGIIDQILGALAGKADKMVKIAGIPLGDGISAEDLSVALSIPAGSGTFIYVQSSASREWNIEHGLSKYPSVTVVDSAGNVVVGDINYLSNNAISISFVGAFSGKAYLN